MYVWSRMLNALNTVLNNITTNQEIESWREKCNWLIIMWVVRGTAEI